MSFFERMMKLNRPSFKAREEKYFQEVYNEEETGPNQENLPIQQQWQTNKILKDDFLKQSLSLKMSELSQDQGWEDIFEEPSIKPLAKQPKPVLLHHLLPKKQQIMRQMLSRKKQFELKKKNLCAQKREAELQSKLHLESQILKNCEYLSVKTTKLDQSKSQKMKSSSVKAFSGNKTKPAFQLGESIYSASLQTQLVTSPLASDAFNKEIMLKLINIIEKDRTVQGSHPQIAQVSLPSNSEPKQKKQSPIIINNIMKTPMEAINRDLIQRQMKIRMLENTRQKRQYSKCSDSKAINRISEKAEQGKQASQDELILTERTNSRPSMKGFSVSLNSCQKQSQIKSVREVIKQQNCQKENLLCSASFSAKPFQTLLNDKLTVDQSTKNNSSQNSRVNQNIIIEEDNKRKREFKKGKQDRKQDNQFQKISQIGSSSKAQRQIEERSLQASVKHEPVKAPVKMEILLENQTQTQGMTLAEAFKRKKGRLRSQQKHSQKSSLQSPLKKQITRLQSFPSQMAITISDKFTEYNSQIAESAPITGKVINISLQGPPSKRAMTSENASKQTSVRKQIKDSEKPSAKKTVEPSKKLIDRLIYGERAKVTKQEMYALTRKNYNNLPEVQAKRKEEQKRKIEQDRINKAKQYQRSIRCGRSQMKSQN